VKKYILINLSICVFGLSITTSSTAALVSRLSGQAVYDADLDITWLSDMNLSGNNTFGVSGVNTGGTISHGAMTWAVANNWLAAMNTFGSTGFLGFSGWRMPTTAVPDSSCGLDPSQPIGSNCTGSEMGHLFYNEFAATANTSVIDTGNPAELDKFSNVALRNFYWSGTGYATNLSRAWVFDFFGDGGQGPVIKNAGGYVLPVADGDVFASSVVPIPPAAWLFGTGLIGIIGMAKRK